MLFYIVLIIVVMQRIIELVIAKRNEKWMRAQGAFEVGAKHYPWMVALHVGFFVALIAEVDLAGREPSTLWPIFLTLFFIAQIARFWCLFSLGKFWNTKIIILPGADVVRKGPYRFIRHPNYAIVAIELLTLPLLFNAYTTAILFSLLNIWILSVRIRAEEQALIDATNYKTKFRLQ